MRMWPYRPERRDECFSRNKVEGQGYYEEHNFRQLSFDYAAQNAAPLRTKGTENQNCLPRTEGSSHIQFLFILLLPERSYL